MGENGVRFSYAGPAARADILVELIEDDDGEVRWILPPLPVPGGLEPSPAVGLATHVDARLVTTAARLFVTRFPEVHVEVDGCEVQPLTWSSPYGGRVAGTYLIGAHHLEHRDTVAHGVPAGPIGVASYPAEPHHAIASDQQPREDGLWFTMCGQVVRYRFEGAFLPTDDQSCSRCRDRVREPSH